MSKQNRSLSIHLIIICLFSQVSLAGQSQVPATEDHFDILDRAINHKEIEVFLIKSGDVDSRARSCGLMKTTSKGKGFYTVRGKSVKATRNRLVVLTETKDRKIVQHGSGVRCARPNEARSSNPEVLSREGVPSI